MNRQTSRSKTSPNRSTPTRPYVNERRCLACGACLAVCPANPCVFELEEAALTVHPEACTGCGRCMQACRLDAVFVEMADENDEPPFA